eukprot:2564461-Rhodomonas_salina.1
MCIRDRDNTSGQTGARSTQTMLNWWVQDTWDTCSPTSFTTSGSGVRPPTLAGKWQQQPEPWPTLTLTHCLHSTQIPRMEEEKHQDILIDLLNALRRRTAPTLVVWVAAHIGDPGNELADMAANAGT